MILGFQPQFVDKILSGAKIHSIREDKNNRWKIGMTIHFATGVRTKKYKQFSDKICTGVQKIELRWTKGISFTYVDGKRLDPFELTKLFMNDGFTDWNKVIEFFGYKRFSGVIIHWTNKRY